MKALILNSGLGSRMGVLTSEHPKCMTEISHSDTILSRQLKLIDQAGITEVVMTTGYYDSILEEYCESLDLPLHITFVKNPVYDKTNYIYSIYCAREHLDDDIILMHGDLVFENTVFDDVLASNESCMTVSSTLPLPEKDFKAVLTNGRITKVGIEFFENAVAAQPLYKLNKNDWKVWLDRIIAFCESDKTKCYAENAFNDISDSCKIVPLDVKDRLCAEIDNPDDLKKVSDQLKEIENRAVYMCFSTDIIHSGHIAIINKAKRYGKLMIGLLTKAQSFEFQYQGKSLTDGATVTIVAEEDAWGVLSCETNPASNPKNGLMLKLLNGNSANVKAELQIEEQTFEAARIQWCMGGNCEMFGVKNYLKKEYVSNGEDQVQFDASDITTKGHLLAKITVTCSLESHSVH